MTKLRSWVVLAACLSLVACATLSRTPTDTSSSLVEASREELVRSFGRTDATNPYIEPVGMFYGRHEEFVIARLTTALPSAGRVQVEARLDSALGGAIEARLMDAQSLRDFWADFESEVSEMTDAKRIAAIDRSALPASSFTAPAGICQYYVVLKGAYPLPRPSIATFVARIANEEPLMLIIKLEETSGTAKP